MINGSLLRTVGVRTTSRLGWGVLAFLALAVGYPIASMVARFLSIGDRSESSVWAALEGRIVVFTVTQAVVSTLLTLLVGLPLAHVLARYSFKGRAAVQAATLVPFVLPTVVVAVAVRRLLEPVGVEADGIKGSLTAILLAHVVFNVSVVVRVVGGFWRQLDNRAEQAAAVLGASPAQVFKRITLPRILPSIAAAAAVVFFFTFTSFGVIVILGGLSRATIETEIYRYAITRSDFGSAAVLAVVQALAVGALAIFTQRLQRRISTAAGEGPRSAMPRPIGLRQKLHILSVVGFTLTLLLSPLLILLWRSLIVDGSLGVDNYRQLATRPVILPVSPLRAVGNSVLFAALAAALASAIGGIAALAAQGPGRLARAVEVAALVPLGISAVTLGFGYLVGFTFADLRSSPVLVIVAHAVIGIPFVVASVLPALRALDGGVIDAAAALGGSRLRILQRVALPLLRPALVAGAGFAAAVSLGEFGASGFLARSRSSFTAPQAIFGLLGRPSAFFQGQAAALCVVLGVVVVLLVTVIDRGRADNGRGWL